MKRVIEFLVKENGKSPALEFYNSLDEKIKNKFRFLFTRMEEFGKISDPTKFNAEPDGFYCFKYEQVRFIAFMDKEKIILTHGFIKKEQKLPARELEKARVARREYEN